MALVLTPDFLRASANAFVSMLSLMDVAEKSICVAEPFVPRECVGPFDGPRVLRDAPTERSELLLGKEESSDVEPTISPSMKASTSSSTLRESSIPFFVRDSRLRKKDCARCKEPNLA